MKPVLGSGYGRNYYSMQSKLARILWNFVYFVFFRYSPVPLFKYRNFLLRLFGAKIDKSCRIYSSARIWWPGNLEMGCFVAIAEGVNIYNQGRVYIGDYSIISQESYVCASTHDYNDVNHELLLRDIKIGCEVWICAGAFVGPGALIENGVVVGARSVIFGVAESWKVYAGNPARMIKERKYFERF